MINVQFSIANCQSLPEGNHYQTLEGAAAERWASFREFWRFWSVANGTLERFKNRMLWLQWLVGADAERWASFGGFWSLANGALERLQSRMLLPEWLVKAAGKKTRCCGLSVSWELWEKSTPAVVPGAAPALAKAGVGGLISISIINHH